MGDLSKNFSRSEFECECGCGMDTVDFMLVTVLQRIADELGANVFITGPNRCVNHNRYIDGAADSQHLYCKAADFKVYVSGLKISPELIYSMLDKWYPDTFGIGLYGNRTHLDIRKRRSRWNAS